MNARFLGSVLGMALLIAGCDSGGNRGGSGTGAKCDSPTPAGTMDAMVTVNIPSDFDETANPTPTTTIPFTVLMPERCAGDRFPLVLQSHGYAGSRTKTLAANGDLKPDDPHFTSIDELVQALPFHGYVVISFDERGHGQNVPSNGGGNARVIDPNAETQDARAILDWAFDHASEIQVQTESGTGVAKDLKVGTLGLSYGGGFQFPLAALDSRIDTIVPNGTWHDLLYSLLPGDAVKLSWDGLLCAVATGTVPGFGGATNTPLVQTLCNITGAQNPMASTIRTRADLVAAGSAPTAQPRPVTEEETDALFFTHSMDFFESQQAAGAPWGFSGNAPPLRKIPALFLQGNRDNLFNITEAFWNLRYFGATGADVRLITTEGGHMNPLANQDEGTANCGKVIGVEAILTWFDHFLKGQDFANFDAIIPTICISVADTEGAGPDVTPAGVILDEVPVGSLSGTGAVPAALDSMSVSVTSADNGGVFMPVVTIEGDDKVLAGIPRLSKITVTRGSGALQTAIAFVGVGINRGGTLIKVDDQVTPFVEGDHATNRGVLHDELLLPGVGEKLQDGDQVGLLFFPQDIQYNAINDVAGTPNSYNADLTGIELPIFVPGQFAGSSLSE